jgi:gliding motility-associated-like protein
MKSKLLLFYILIFLSPFISNASCPGDTARFTTNAPRCISDSVQFTDISTNGGGIANWSWSFGDPGSGVNNTSILQNPAHLYSAGNQSFNVRLIVTYTLGCIDTMTIGVGIQNLVVANAGANIVSCDNNLTVNLTGTILNAGGGSWSGYGAFSNSSSLTPIYTPTEASKMAGMDTVVLTSFSSPYCPNVTDTVLIIFNPGPTVNAGPDVSVCKDAFGVPVSATSTGATGGNWVTTGTGGTFTNATLNATTYFPSSSDTAAGSVILYRETTGTGICLAARDSLTITFTELPTIFIKTEDSSCSSSPILLDVTVSTGSGTWSSTGTGNFIPNTTTLNGVYYPSSADDLAGIITLKFVSGNNGGCQSVSDTLNVIIKPSPTAGFTSVSACANDNVVFTNTSTPTGTIINSTWTFGDLSLPSNTTSPAHSYSSCGSKSVLLTVTSINGCIDSNLQSVPVYCIPVANFTANGVCLNDGTTFNNTTTINNSTIASSNWTFGDATSSTLLSPTHHFPSSGSFSVNLVVQSAQGCSNTITQTVSLVSGPVAIFTVSDATAEINQNIVFQDHSTSTLLWSWNFGDSNQGSTLQNPSHKFTTGGVFDVCLVASDVSGCNDTTCQKEIVSTYPAGPSAFSPNGDGQNDVFYLFGGPFKTLVFRIFNNWGEVIFETTKQTTGWDGKFKGIDQAIGVYVYTVVGITEDDIEFKTSGDVTLLR